MELNIIHHWVTDARKYDNIKMYSFVADRESTNAEWLSIG